MAVTGPVHRPSAAEQAGRGLVKILKGIFGGRSLTRAKESVEVLKREFKEGRVDPDRAEPAARRIEHREKISPDEREEPPPAP